MEPVLGRDRRRPETAPAPPGVQVSGTRRRSRLRPGPRRCSRGSGRRPCLSRTKKTFGAFARIPISRTGRAGMRSESQSTRPPDAGFFPSIGLWRVSKRTRFRQGWRVRLRIGHGQVPHRQAKACPTAASHSADSLSTSLGRLTRIADMSQFNPSTDRSPLTPRGSEGPIAVTKSTRIGPPAVNLTPMPHRHIVTGRQLLWSL